jgi:hypothetical protein
VRNGLVNMIVGYLEQAWLFFKINQNIVPLPSSHKNLIFIHFFNFSQL